MTQTSNENTRDRTVIITGASGNLGSAVTRTFLAKGYSVIATVTNQEAIKELPQDGKLKAVVVDLADEEQATAFVRSSIDTYKKIDAALMLVGGFAMGNIADTSGNDIKKQVALNFDTAYYISRPLLAHMLQNNEGRLVFIGSRPSLQPKDGKNMIAYGLSKSLLFKLAEFINAEAKGKNVAATVIVPSTLDTPANRKSMPDADPKKWVRTEDLAEILAFICSDKAAALRETVLKVYGGA